MRNFIRETRIIRTVSCAVKFERDENETDRVLCDVKFKIVSK